MRGIGKRIQKMREQAEFTQESLAEEVDISASYLSAIERGVKTPTLDTCLLYTSPSPRDTR